MKTKNNLLLILMSLLITLTTHSCWLDDLFKENKELPPITQTGEDTFGCLVDGELWLPKGQLLTTSKTLVELERWYGNIRIWKINANRRVSSGFSFRIPEEGFNEGVASITVDKSQDLGIYFSWEDNYPDENFTWNKNLQGELIISKLDTINKIVAGTFWFDLIGDKGTKVEIRDGRFDLKINTIEPL
jgi:hypothetical protein